MKNLILGFGYVLVILITIWSTWTCKDQVAGDDINKIVFPDSNVSYSKHVEPLFLSVCAIPGGCHAGDEPAAGVNLETYNDAISKVGIILRGDPENSRLIWAIEGRDPNVPRMPLDLPPLNANQIKGLKTWIKEGAKNN
jgi:hypothetical protein